MFELFNNFLILIFTYLIPKSGCTQNDFLKTINDLLLLLNSGVKPKYSSIVESNLEKVANISILLSPNNFWSILVLDKIIYYFLIIILVLPLIFCVAMLYIFLYNQI